MANKIAKSLTASILCAFGVAAGGCSTLNSERGVNIQTIAEPQDLQTRHAQLKSYVGQWNRQQVLSFLKVKTPEAMDAMTPEDISKWRFAGAQIHVPYALRAEAEAENKRYSGLWIKAEFLKSKKSFGFSAAISRTEGYTVYFPVIFKNDGQGKEVLYLVGENVGSPLVNRIDKDGYLSGFRGDSLIKALTPSL